MPHFFGGTRDCSDPALSLVFRHRPQTHLWVHFHTAGERNWCHGVHLYVVICMTVATITLHSLFNGEMTGTYIGVVLASVGFLRSDRPCERKVVKITTHTDS